MYLIELNYIAVPSLDKAWLQKMRGHKNDLFKAICIESTLQNPDDITALPFSLFLRQRVTARERKSIKSAV